MLGMYLLEPTRYDLRVQCFTGKLQVPRANDRVDGEKLSAKPYFASEHRIVVRGPAMPFDICSN